MNERSFSAAEGLKKLATMQRGITAPRTCEDLRLFRWDCTQMFQVALVSDQHNDDVGVSVVSQLL